MLGVHSCRVDCEGRRRERERQRERDGRSRASRSLATGVLECVREWRVRAAGAGQSDKEGGGSRRSLGAGGCSPAGEEPTRLRLLCSSHAVFVHSPFSADADVVRSSTCSSSPPVDRAARGGTGGRLGERGRIIMIIIKKMKKKEREEEEEEEGEEEGEGEEEETRRMDEKPGVLGSWIAVACFGRLPVPCLTCEFTFFCLPTVDCCIAISM